MTTEQAASILGVYVATPARDIRRTYEALYNDLQIRLANAPTPKLRSVYQSNLTELRSALEVLLPGTANSDAIDLPATEPVYSSAPIIYTENATTVTVPPAEGHVRASLPGQGQAQAQPVHERTFVALHRRGLMIAGSVAAIVLVAAFGWMRAPHRANQGPVEQTVATVDGASSPDKMSIGPPHVEAALSREHGADAGENVTAAPVSDVHNAKSGNHNTTGPRAAPETESRPNAVSGQGLFLMPGFGGSPAAAAVSGAPTSARAENSQATTEAAQTDAQREPQPGSACEAGDLLACQRECDESVGFSAPCQRVAAAYRSGEALPTFERACEQGNLYPCYQVAEAYSWGKYGKPKDGARAASLYQRACDGGHARACESLGYAYQMGQGVRLDLDKARELYRRTCELVSAKICRNLEALGEHWTPKR